MTGKPLVAMACCLIFLAMVAPMTAQEERNGIELQNAGLLLEDLQIGRTYCLSNPNDNPNVIKVIARNNLSQGVWMNLTFIKPSNEEYYQKLLYGYEDIPDTNWVFVDESRKWCPAGGEVEYDLWVSIPNDPQYDEKRYQVTMYLENEPPEGSNINMAIFGRIQLATMKSEGVVSTSTLTVIVLNSNTQVQVKDTERIPIAGCSVSLIGAQGITNTVTDSDGNAYFDDVPPLGDYVVTVSKDDYVEYNKEVSITENGNYIIDIQLQKMSEGGISPLVMGMGLLAIGVVAVLAIVTIRKK